VKQEPSTDSRLRRLRPPPPLLLLLLELALAAALSATVCTLTRSDIVWVVSGVAAGWAASALFRALGHAQTPNRPVRMLGQILVGVGLGPLLAEQDLAAVSGDLPVVVLSIGLTLLGGLLVAWLLSRTRTVDPTTAGLATMPGGMGLMASIAAETGRPAPYVALVQGVRVALVVSAAPMVVIALGHATHAGNHALTVIPDDGFGWFYWPALIIAGVVAAQLATRWKVPVPYLMGPMVAGMIAAFAIRMSDLGPEATILPSSHSIVGQILLGITIGEFLSQPAGLPRRILLRGFAGSVATVLLAFAGAWALSAATGWSYLTAMLVLAPGGAPEMIVLAAAVPDGLAIVVAAQLLRQIAVNALMPLWLAIFKRWRNTAEPPPDSQPSRTESDLSTSSAQRSST